VWSHSPRRSTSSTLWFHNISRYSRLSPYPPSSCLVALPALPVPTSSILSQHTTSVHLAFYHTLSWATRDHTTTPHFTFLLHLFCSQHSAYRRSGCLAVMDPPVFSQTNMAHAHTRCHGHATPQPPSHLPSHTGTTQVPHTYPHTGHAHPLPHCTHTPHTPAHPPTYIGSLPHTFCPTAPYGRFSGTLPGRCSGSSAATTALGCHLACFPALAAHAPASPRTLLHCILRIQCPF